MELPCKNRLLLLLTALMVLLQISGSNGCFQEEKTALLDFKAFAKFNNVSGKPFLSSWINDSDGDCCQWERVTCDPHSNHVIHLSLGSIYQDCNDWMSLNFSYFLPLKQLKNLDLSNGCLKDGIMSEGMSTLTMLETLDLSYNWFDRSILKSLTAFKSLKNLILANNNMSGQIPIQGMSTLTMLETLDLSSNWLDTNILKSLTAFKSLKNLILANDLMSGQIPIQANLSSLEILILKNSVQMITRLQIKGLCKMKNLQELDLSGNYFIGTLPSCLGNFTSLRALDLSKNFLSGGVSSSVIASLTSLEFLRISYNKFEGIFSLSSLRNHSKLKVLILGEMNSSKFQVETENPLWVPSFQLEYLKMPNCRVNLATRTIPSFLLYQHNLRYIDISHNNLIGRFPNWLLANNPKLCGVLSNDNSFTGTFQLPFNPNQHMDQLQMLNISNNKIQGELLDNIGFIFPNLKCLDVSNNEFDGQIPASIGEMSNLTFLDLANNQFVGKVPKKMLLGCKLLQILRLSNNRLEGEIFKQMKIRSLLSLALENNNFHGTLQDGLSSMVRLHVLVISNNNFSGELSSCPRKLPELWFLNASCNNFYGVIPNDLCKMHLFHSLDLSHNKLSGSIPTCLSSLQVRTIHLQGNNLTGPLPEALISNPELKFLNVRDNRVSGSIPKNISLFVNLKILLLGGNQLQGHIHNQICQLQKLVFLDLSRNNLTGSIPLCFNNMSFGKEDQNEDIYMYDDFKFIVFMHLYDGKFYYPYLHFGEETYYHTYDQPSSSVEEQYTTKSLFLAYKGKILNNMAGMDLSCNQMLGEIPKQIGDLNALLLLNLSHNQLNGSIPENFRNLRNVESLDLSYNHLSGTIPLQLQELNFLSVFNVSYNNLSGQAPNQRQFGSFDESSYIGNPYLLVNNSNKRIPTSQPPPSTPEEDSPIDFTVFCWCFGASYIMVLVVFVTILWINPCWRRRWFYFIETCLYNCFGHFLDGAFY